MQIYLCAAVCLIGLLMYTLAPDAKPKIAEVGRIMFAFGLLVFLLVFNTARLTLFH